MSNGINIIFAYFFIFYYYSINLPTYEKKLYNHSIAKPLKKIIDKKKKIPRIFFLFKLYLNYFTVRIRIVFVPPVPTGTPATITMLSPDSTRPDSNATFQQHQTYHQLSLVFQ